MEGYSLVRLETKEDQQKAIDQLSSPSVPADPKNKGRQDKRANSGKNKNLPSLPLYLYKEEEEVKVSPVSTVSKDITTRRESVRKFLATPLTAVQEAYEFAESDIPNVLSEYEPIASLRADRRRIKTKCAALRASLLKIEDAKKPALQLKLDELVAASTKKKQDVKDIEDACRTRIRKLFTFRDQATSRSPSPVGHAPATSSEAPGVAPINLDSNPVPPGGGGESAQ